jgi:hypothetical protein
VAGHRRKGQGPAERQAGHRRKGQGPAERQAGFALTLPESLTTSTVPVPPQPSQSISPESQNRFRTVPWFAGA